MLVGRDCRGANVREAGAPHVDALVYVVAFKSEAGEAPGDLAGKLRRRPSE